jgi:hypothetical protein
MALRAIILALAALAVAVLPSVAQSPAGAPGDVYAVRGVEIDRSAATAAQARDQAIAEGQRAAWGRLVERLVPSQRRAGVPSLPANDVAALIESFEVESERQSGTRWIGSLGYRFRPAAVRALLRDRAVPYAETPARRILVVPVLARDGQALLWEDENQWRTAWGQLPPPLGLQPWVLPSGDLEDVALIGADQAANGDRARLRALAARHGAQGALVVVADAGAAAVGGVFVQMQFLRVGAPAPDADWPESVRLADGETPEAAWPRIAAAAAETIEERWKAEVLVREGESGTLRASVPVADLGEWIAIRRRLAEVAAVRRFDVLVLGRGGAIVDIAHEGPAEALRTALAQRDLSLAEEEGMWRLALAERSSVRP